MVTTRCPECGLNWKRPNGALRYDETICAACRRKLAPVDWDATDEADCEVEHPDEETRAQLMARMGSPRNRKA